MLQVSTRISSLSPNASAAWWRCCGLWDAASWDEGLREARCPPGEEKPTPGGGFPWRKNAVPAALPPPAAACCGESVWRASGPRGPAREGGGARERGAELCTSRPPKPRRGGGGQGGGQQRGGCPTCRGLGPVMRCGGGSGGGGGGGGQAGARRGAPGVLTSCCELESPTDGGGEPRRVRAT